MSWEEFDQGGGSTENATESGCFLWDEGARFVIRALRRAGFGTRFVMPGGAERAAPLGGACRARYMKNGAEQCGGDGRAGAERQQGAGGAGVSSCGLAGAVRGASGGDVAVNNNSNMELRLLDEALVEVNHA